MYRKHVYHLSTKSYNNYKSLKNKMTDKTTKKILIIEDETMLQETLIEKLSSEGYSVRGCVSAEDAFDLIKEDKPDLILTDLVLNNVDGFEILRILKENFNLNDIPVMVLTNLPRGGGC